MPRMVEAVLRTWGAVKVNPDFRDIVSSPSDLYVPGMHQRPSGRAYRRCHSPRTQSICVNYAEVNIKMHCEQDITHALMSQLASL
jgi:hypothetical protein